MFLSQKKNHNDLINSLGFNHEKIDLKYFSENIKGKYKQKTIRRPQLNLFKGILEMSVAPSSL